MHNHFKTWQELKDIKKRAEEALDYAKKMRRKYRREKNRAMATIADEFVETAKYIITGRRKEPNGVKELVKAVKEYKKAGYGPSAPIGEFMVKVFEDWKRSLRH